MSPLAQLTTKTSLIEVSPTTLEQKNSTDKRSLSNSKVDVCYLFKVSYSLMLFSDGCRLASLTLQCAFIAEGTVFML